MGVGIVSETDRDVVADEVGVSTSTLGLMKSYFSNNKHQAYAYLLFILLYFPCVAAFGAIIKEGGVFLGTLNALYLTLLAWITATLYYQISWGHSVLWIILPVVFLGTIAIAMLLLGKSKFSGYREEE